MINSLPIRQIGKLSSPKKSDAYKKNENRGQLTYLYLGALGHFKVTGILISEFLN